MESGLWIDWLGICINWLGLNELGRVLDLTLQLQGILMYLLQEELLLLKLLLNQLLLTVVGVEGMLSRRWNHFGIKVLEELLLLLLRILSLWLGLFLVANDCVILLWRESSRPCLGLLHLLERCESNRSLVWDFDIFPKGIFFFFLLNLCGRNLMLV